MMYRLKKKEKQQREEQWRWFNQILGDNKTKLGTYQAELFESSRRIRELQQTLEQNEASQQQTGFLHEELQYYIALETDVREKEKALRLREKQLLSESSLKAVMLLNQMKSAPAYLPVKTPKSGRRYISRLSHQSKIPHPKKDGNRRKRCLCTHIDSLIRGNVRIALWV